MAPLRAGILVLLLTITGLGCGGKPAAPPPKDLEFAQSMNTARVAFERGQIGQAILLYEQSLRRASARDDAADIGEAAYNLGVCLFDDGQLARAETTLETARLELARAARRTDDVRLMQAKLSRAIGPSSKQDAAAIATEVTSSKTATPAERCQAHTLLAGLDVDAGRLDAAAARLAEARKLVGGDTARSRDALNAGIAGVEGRLAMARGDAKSAAAAFDRQALLSQSTGLFGDMARALLSAGKAHQDAGDASASADRFFRAARSLLAQGDVQRGTTAAQDAITAADRAGDAMLAARAKALIDVPATKPKD